MAAIDEKEMRTTIQNLVNKTFNEAVMTNMDSGLIFSYVSNLEKEYEKLKKNWEEFRQYCVDYKEAKSRVWYGRTLLYCIIY